VNWYFAARTITISEVGLSKSGSFKNNTQESSGTRGAISKRAPLQGAAIASLAGAMRPVNPNDF